MIPDLPYKTNRIAHIGLAVKSLDESLRLYQGALGLPLHGRETVEGDKVSIAFLPIGDTEVELLEPTGPDSPVARFIEKRGEGIHHVAFEVDDIEEALSSLREKGFRLIDDEPRTGAGGVRCSTCGVPHPAKSKAIAAEKRAACIA